MKEILNRILNHEELTREETKNILIGITQSAYPDEQITALLTGLQMRGITVDELLGFRDGILETAFLYRSTATDTLTLSAPEVTGKTHSTSLQQLVLL